jgi:hypothetical protein
MMKHYSTFLTVWKALLTLGTAFGVLSLADYAKLEAPMTWDAFLLNGTNWLIAALPALLRVVENVRKNWRTDGTPLWNWPVSVSKLIVGALVLCLTLPMSGCITPARAGKQSKIETSFEEKTAAGDFTKIVHKASGEASTEAGIVYTGATTDGEDTVTPWNLSVQSNASITSPQAQAVAEGYKALLEQTPQTVEELSKTVGQVFALKIPDATSPADQTPSILAKMRDAVISSLFDKFKARIGL